MSKTDSVVRCIHTVYHCLLRVTSTAREWVLRLAPGGFFFVRYNNTCIKQSPQIMSTPGDHTQEPNMEGQETVAPIATEPRLEDKKVEDDPVIEPNAKPFLCDAHDEEEKKELLRQVFGYN